MDPVRNASDPGSGRYGGPTVSRSYPRVGVRNLAKLAGNPAVCQRLPRRYPLGRASFFGGLVNRSGRYRSPGYDGSITGGRGSSTSSRDRQPRHRNARNVLHVPGHRVSRHPEHTHQSAIRVIGRHSSNGIGAPSRASNRSGASPTRPQQCDQVPSGATVTAPTTGIRSLVSRSNSSRAAWYSACSRVRHGVALTPAAVTASIVQGLSAVSPGSQNTPGTKSFGRITARWPVSVTVAVVAGAAVAADSSRAYAPTRCFGGVAGAAVPPPRIASQYSNSRSTHFSWIGAYPDGGAGDHQVQHVSPQTQQPAHRPRSTVALTTYRLTGGSGGSGMRKVVLTPHPFRRAQPATACPH